MADKKKLVKDAKMKKGEKIPAKKLDKAESSNPKMKKGASPAKPFGKMNKSKDRG